MAYGATTMPEFNTQGTGGKWVKSGLNILQLNINGMQKIAELELILKTNQIQIACLQETKLNSNLKLHINGYTTVRADCQE